MNIGSTHIHRNELDAAENELDQALDYYESSQVRDYFPELYGLFAELALKRGDLDKAESLGRQSIDLARELKLPVEEGHNLRIMGEIAFASQNLEEAESFFRTANDIVADAGDEYECAKTQLSLAHLYVAMRNVDLAQDALDDCLEIFERLDAKLDLDEARELLTSLQ